MGRPGRDAKTVEVGAGIMPTIAMHLIRQPAGARIDMGKTTTNHLYAESVHCLRPEVRVDRRRRPSPTSRGVGATRSDLSAPIKEGESPK